MRIMIRTETWRWLFGLNLWYFSKGHPVCVWCAKTSSLQRKASFSRPKYPNFVNKIHRKNLMTWKWNEMKSALPCVSRRRSFFFTAVLKFTNQFLKKTKMVREKRPKRGSRRVLPSAKFNDVVDESRFVCALFTADRYHGPKESFAPYSLSLNCNLDFDNSNSSLAISPNFCVAIAKKML